MNQKISTRNRIVSIDIIRGLVMLLMLLDHTRMFFNRDAFLFEPTDLEQTNLALFFTRWITHFCAPVFILLAGISARLLSQNLSTKELSIWLLKRGFWLIVLELTFIKFAWLFRFDFQNLDLMVIWGIGASMIFLSGLIWLSKRLILGISLLIILSHNLLDGWTATSPALNSIWRVLHVMGFLETDSINVYVSYPLIPMMGLIALGFVLGGLYQVSGRVRKKVLLISGISMITLFAVLRITNWYGDPRPYEWIHQWDITLMSFFNTTKYPHSLLFILMTIGPTFLLMFFLEDKKLRGMNIFSAYGKVPLFFYLIHIFIVHLLAMGLASITGFGAHNMIIDFWVTYQPELKGYGVPLFWTYIITIGIAIVLYPVVKNYRQFKLKHPKWWWLRYL